MCLARSLAEICRGMGRARSAAGLCETRDQDKKGLASPGRRRLLFLFLLFLLLDRLLDGLDEMRAAFVGSELGGVLVGLPASRIFVGGDALVGIAEHAPDDAHARDLGRAGAGLGLGFDFRRGRFFLLLRLLLRGLFVLVLP